MQQVKPLYLSLFLLSVFVPALATVAKEGIFTDAKKKLGRWGPCSSLQNVPDSQVFPPYSHTCLM